MDRASRTTLTTDVDCVVEDCGGGLPPEVSTPPSASADTQKASASAQASTERLSISLSPFSKDRPTLRIVRHNCPATSSVFAHLYEKNPAEALGYADSRLDLARDVAERVRWASNSCIALRALFETRSALRTHLAIEPLASLLSDPHVKGLHEHGLAFTRMELGDLESALRGFRRSRELYLSAGAVHQSAAADNNAGLVLVKMGRAAEALPLVRSAIATAEGLRDYALAAEFADTLRAALAALALKGEG